MVVDEDTGDDGTKVLPQDGGIQYWELIGGAAYLIVPSDKNLVMTHLGGGSFYFSLTEWVDVSET